MGRRLDESSPKTELDVCDARVRAGFLGLHLCFRIHSRRMVETGAHIWGDDRCGVLSGLVRAQQDRQVGRIERLRTLRLVEKLSEKPRRRPSGVCGALRAAKIRWGTEERKGIGLWNLDWKNLRERSTEFEWT